MFILQDDLNDEERNEVTTSSMEKVVDLRGRPYTAADEYAARLVVKLQHYNVVLRRLCQQPF